MKHTEHYLVHTKYIIKYKLILRYYTKGIYLSHLKIKKKKHLKAGTTTISILEINHTDSPKLYCWQVVSQDLNSGSLSQELLG